MFQGLGVLCFAKGVRPCAAVALRRRPWQCTDHWQPHARIKTMNRRTGISFFPAQSQTGWLGVLPTASWSTAGMGTVRTKKAHDELSSQAQSHEPRQPRHPSCIPKKTPIELRTRSCGDFLMTADSRAVCFPHLSYSGANRGITS